MLLAHPIPRGFGWAVLFNSSPEGCCAVLLRLCVAAHEVEWLEIFSAGLT
jgi:hypothetical protein